MLKAVHALVYGSIQHVQSNVISIKLYRGVGQGPQLGDLLGVVEGVSIHMELAVP